MNQTEGRKLPVLTDRVIQRGDALDGATVVNILCVREGLNLICLAQLDDGRTVVVLATPQTN